MLLPLPIILLYCTRGYGMVLTFFKREVKKIAWTTEQSGGCAELIRVRVSNGCSLSIQHSTVLHPIVAVLKFRKGNNKPKNDACGLSFSRRNSSATCHRLKTIGKTISIDSKQHHHGDVKVGEPCLSQPTVLSKYGVLLSYQVYAPLQG